MKTAEPVKTCPQCGADHMEDQIGYITYCTECDPDGTKDRELDAERKP